MVSSSFLLSLVLVAVGLPDVQAPPGPGYLGVSLLDAGGPRQGGGALVTGVVPGSAAQEVGLRVGDVILQANEAKATSAQALVSTLKPSKPGDKVRLRYRRNGEEQTIVVFLRRRPKPSALLEQKNPPRAKGPTINARQRSLPRSVMIGSGNFVVYGSTQIFGSYSQIWVSVCDMTLESRDQKEIVKVAGDVSLGGILKVSFANVQPQQGDSFELFSGAKSLEGGFEELMLPPAGAGLRWDLIYDDIAQGRDLDGDGLYDLTLRLVRADAKRL